MSAYYRTERVTVIHGDCIDAMRAMPAGSIDAIVTDPPYGLGFMGKTWDAMPPGADWSAECLRVLKPGGHLLAFGGTRTAHRLAVAVEDAGFEIRDSIAWLYGSGFPKSMDVSKAIDKAAGATRDSGARVWSGGARRGGVMGAATGQNERTIYDAPATDDAARWEGWGTALKPAHEPIVVARKPPVGSVTTNVLAHGTGALNIDACRIPTVEKLGGGSSTMNDGWARPWADRPEAVAAKAERSRASVAKSETLGRWPANVVLDESAADALDEQSGMLTSGANPTRRGAPKFRTAYGVFEGQQECRPARGVDSGGASRFFYVAKASRAERPNVDGVAHPTVKPVALMRWLVRLVTPPDGVVLDPFAGSGTTIEAAIREGFQAVGIEREAEYLPLITARLTRMGAVTPSIDGDARGPGSGSGNSNSQGTLPLWEAS